MIASKGGNTPRIIIGKVQTDQEQLYTLLLVLLYRALEIRYLLIAGGTESSPEIHDEWMVAA
jgi:hypothetical protein